MSELFSIQLQNRQQQGRDGVWLDLPTTTEQVQAALRQIGISSDNPQGLFISGYFAEEEKRFAIPYNMVLASNVDELNFLAARLETLSAGERAELNAALQAPQSELSSIGKITDFPENVEYYVHLPEVRGPAQLGDYYLNRSGMVDMPEEWKGGIDTAQFGRYVAQQEQGAFTQYGYLVKSGDAWQKVHEGQPVPEEYRVLSFPAPEVLQDSANIPPPVQPEMEPQKVIPIILNGKDSAERMKEITDRLETGIQQFCLCIQIIIQDCPEFYRRNQSLHQLFLIQAIGLFLYHRAFLCLKECSQSSLTVLCSPGYFRLNIV